VRISMRPRRSEASTIWSTIYANRSNQDRLHLPDQIKRCKMGTEHRLPIKSRSCQSICGETSRDGRYRMSRQRFVSHAQAERVEYRPARQRPASAAALPLIAATPAIRQRGSYPNAAPLEYRLIANTNALEESGARSCVADGRQISLSCRSCCGARVCLLRGRAGTAISRQVADPRRARRIAVNVAKLPELLRRAAG
jgi:hypothetical protein